MGSRRRSLTWRSRSWKPRQPPKPNSEQLGPQGSMTASRHPPSLNHPCISSQSLEFSASSISVSDVADISKEDLGCFRPRLSCVSNHGPPGPGLHNWQVQGQVLQFLILLWLDMLACEQ